MTDLQKIRSVFCEALEKETLEEREAFLGQVCGDDLRLRAEIDALLKAQSDADNFFKDPLINIGIPEHVITETPGDIIGRYKLLEQIGEGGMAVVYMAEQEEPIRRKVALKIIKLGMDTKSVIARFEAERQALAMMDHPNIAKVLDAGATDTGRPYFVMELVKGASITEFCDANNLSTTERLKLFVCVCQAVQHAHQKGIIHRDIKPSNVMVTLHDGVPVPKVIDFGIVKAIDRRLTEKTLFTRYAQIIGTPTYMSPEQAEMSGLDIDIRTDVYSLGTLLYELLTGSPPFTSEYLLSKSYEEMQRIIREEEPTRPSTKISTLGQALIEIAKYRNTSPETLEKLIRADLDWIVMKTLEKDRNRRYDSVSEFASDIRRYLDNEPVVAGPPSATYRVRKFVQRHQVFVMATAIATVGIIMGLIISALMYLRAERAHREETMARADARTVIDFLTNDLLASVYPEKTKSREVTVRYLLDTASKNLENKFENSLLAEAEIRQTLGLTYQKLGDYKAAEPHLERSLKLYRDQLGPEDPNTLTALNNLGWLYCRQSRYDEAEPLLLKALEKRTHILGEEHPDTLETMSNLGWQYICQNRFDEGMQLTSKVLEIGTRILGEEHPTVLNSMFRLAIGYITLTQYDKAEDLSKKGLKISRRVLGDEHETTLYLMNTLVWSYNDHKRYDTGLPLAIEAFETSQRIFGEGHQITIQAMNNLGSIYAGLNRYDEAAPLLTRSVELANQVLGERETSTIFFTFRLYFLYLAMRRHQQADALLMKLLPISRQVQGEKHPQYHYIVYHLRDRTNQLSIIAKEQYDSNDYQNALSTYIHIEQMHRTLYGESNPSDIGHIAMCLYHLGRDDEAHAEITRLRVMYEHGEHIHEESHLYHTELLFTHPGDQLYQAWSHIESGELDEAFETVRELASPDPNNPAIAESIGSLTKALARAYCIRGKRARLDEDYERAISNFETAVAIQPTYAFPLNQFARLLAACTVDEIRDIAKAIQSATEACELTQWQKAEYLDTLAAAYANDRDFADAIEWQKTAIDLLPKGAHQGVRTDYAGRLALYKSGRPFRMHNQKCLVAKWDFEEVVKDKTLDASGNGLDGKLLGDAQIVADPERGNVLNLSGNGYVDCGTNEAFDITGPISVAAWIKMKGYEKGFQMIIIKGETAWRLQRLYKKGIIHFTCPGLDLPDHDPTELMGTIPLNDGAWHHIAGVYDGMKMSLYIDGNLDVSANVGGLMTINDSPVYMGAYPKQPGYEWNGLIDDVRIYNYGLSELEITALYSGQESKI